MASKTLKASVLIGGSISSSFQSALGKTKTGLDQIGQAIVNVDKRQRLLGQSIQTFGRMGSNVDGLRRQYDELTRASERLRAAQSRLATANAAVDANMARRQQMGGQLGGAVASAAALGYAVGAPVMNAANYQRENQLIGNTANMTPQEVGALDATIMAESKATNQGANELQRGIGFLVAAGLDARRAQESIRTIGRTTTAAGAEIEDLSKASFTLIDALNIKPEALQGSLDILAYAGKEGNVELKDMAKVLPVLGASFKSLRLEGTEAVATMGAALEIARKGAGSADEAANNMQNFMAKMQSPETLKKAQKLYGIDLNAIIKKAQKTGENPFDATLMAIMKATGDDPKKIGELFGDMQVQNFLKPMIQNWGEYQRIKNEALTKSGGTTDRDFDRMMKTQAEQFKAARISADNLAKTFGMALLPTIGSLAVKLGVLLDKTTAFVKDNPALVVGVTKAATAVVGLRVAALAGGYAFTFIRAPFLQLSAAVARFRAARAVGELGRLGTAAVSAGSWVGRIGLAFAGLGAGPVLGGIAVLVGAALLVRRYWEPIKAFFSGLWQSFSTEAQPALGAFLGAVQPLKPAWDAVVGVVGQAFDWFVKLIDPASATTEEIGRAAQAGRIVGLVLANSVKNAVVGFGLVVKAVVWVGEAIGTTAGMIVVGWQSAWDQVKGIVGSAVDWIAAAIKPITASVAWIRDTAGSVGNTFGGMFGTAADATEAALTTQGQTPPPLPPTAAARGGASTTVQQQNTFHITQQPGESQEALARRIADEQRRAEEVKKRGRLTD
ncbi:tail length-measure protein [Xanthomonas phage M29]|nr:tail length-measure protein [Xanthomonas phage M29]